MGLFSGISSASKNGGRAPFISRPGTYLMEVTRYTSGENRGGNPFAQIDLKVLYVIATASDSNVEAWNEQNPSKAISFEPHAAGQMVSNRVAVKGGDLKSVHLGEIRSFTEGIAESLVDGDMSQFSEAFGIDYNEDSGFDDAGLEALIEGLSDGDGTDGAGALLLVQTDARVKRDRSGAYVVSGFSCGNKAAKALVEEGKITTPDILSGEE